MSTAAADLEFAYLDEFDFEALPEDAASSGQPTYVVEVRFPHVNRVARYEAGDHLVRRGDKVVIETERGLALAVAVTDPRCERVNEVLPRVVRLATEADGRQEGRNQRREEEALRFCWERVRARKLPMKLIRVEYLHNGNKAVFYFSADGRIDFRELVKDLAYRLNMRVEMRQIGVRDASKMVGGLGICGRELCCSSWLQKFEPVSIRMAKIQNLSLNPQKVSGLCGRLMCCLAYEQQTYQDLRKKLPRVGKRVETPHGEGRVIALDILAELATVALVNGGISQFQATEVQLLPPGADGEPDGTEADDAADDFTVSSPRIPAQGRRRGPRKPWQQNRSGERPDHGDRPPGSKPPKKRR